MVSISSSACYYERTIKKKVRKFSKSNFAKYATCMSTIDWLALVNSCNSVNEATTLFHTAIFHNFNTCFPERTVRVKSSDPAWMKLSLKLLIDDRDRAFHKCKWEKYNRLKEEVIKHIKFLKQNYLREAIESGNLKRLWNSLKTVSR